MLEENPRKRPRLEFEAEGESSVMVQPTSPSERLDVVYDSKYNSPDADICVIRIEETIFKIHRYLLSRDSEMFKDMLTLPQSDEPQGVTEADPIVLYDDLEDFRTLCWGLYARPTDFMAQLAADADMDKLRALARITNKYQFLELEKWALTTIIHHFNAHNLMLKLTLEEMSNYLETACHCSSKELQDIIENGISHRMETDPGSIDWSELIAPIEAYGSRRLKGTMHYRLLMLQDGAPTHLQPNTAALRVGIWSDPDCNRARIAYRGYFALSKWWENFLATEADATRFPKAEACPPEIHLRFCRGHWSNHFKTFVTKVETIQPRLDVLEKLKELQTLAVTATSQPLNYYQSIVPRHCLPHWGLHVAALRKQLIDTMADQFYGCLPAPPANPENSSTSPS